MQCETSWDIIQGTVVWLDKSKTFPSQNWPARLLGRDGCCGSWYSWSWNFSLTGDTPTEWSGPDIFSVPLPRPLTPHFLMGHSSHRWHIRRGSKASAASGVKQEVVAICSFLISEVSAVLDPLLMSRPGEGNHLGGDPRLQRPWKGRAFLCIHSMHKGA